MYSREITQLQNFSLLTVFENRQKVKFNIASEASYVYIFSGQKFIKNAKNRQFGEFLKTWRPFLMDKNEIHMRHFP